MPTFGIIATGFIIITIIGVTLWSKRKDWFGSDSRPAVGTDPEPATEGEPAPAAEVEEVSSPNFWQEAWCWIKKHRDGLLITVGWLALYLLTWYIFPGFRKYLWSMDFFVLASCFTLFALMLKHTGAFRYKLATWGLIFTFFATFVIAVRWLSGLPKGSPPVLAAPATSGSKLPTPPGPNAEGKKIATAFWKSKSDLPPSEQDLMIEVGRRESYGFNQFEADGVTPLQGRDESKGKVKGMYQIHEIWWPQAQALGYDIDTLDGNLQMAYWIRTHAARGADEWSTSAAARAAARESGVVVIAPVGDWTDPIITPGPAGWKTDGKLIFKINAGSPDERIVIPDINAKNVDLGQSRTLSFQSRPADPGSARIPEPVKVTVYR